MPKQSDTPLPGVHTVSLPAFGQGFSTAEVLNVFVRSGDLCSPDEPLLEVEHDKGIVVIQAELSGRIRWICQEGDMFEAGESICTIDVQGESRSKSSQTMPRGD